MKKETFTEKELRAAVVELSQKVGKPILKLTTADYLQNGMEDLVEFCGSAYEANIKAFDSLQHTITGWPGGKPNADDTHRPERAMPYPKRVIIFSPHPDDDVISMGGTLRRLVKQGHDVHVAYETSGNIAVGDEELVRFLHFLKVFNINILQNQDLVIIENYDKIRKALREKKEGDMDIPEARLLKGLIRRGEARLACDFNGIPKQNIHHLDLPFYESGKIEKLPMTDKDIAIVRKLLMDIQPHQIFVAGDLADPHGTHRKCTEAVFQALDQIKAQWKAGSQDATWINYCRVWMYRGAWAEYDISEIEMCVPMSPEELLMKRKSILKHQSQMESAPFLGNDERLFWQRAEDRNRATADQYDKLGMANYEAMEAFVEYKIP